MSLPQSLEEQLASYMELLSSLSIELPEAVKGLAKLAVETLIGGGKLIIVSDAASHSAVYQLNFMLNDHHAEDRPELPLIDFSSVSQSRSSSALLHSLIKEPDLVIVFTERLENILLELVPEQTLVITADDQSHPTTPTLALNSNHRHHWTMSLAVIVNYLSQLIEQQLFGSIYD